jgi:hypothetical protein
MAKKSDKKKSAKKNKPEQLKIEGTGRRDAIPEIEDADEHYRDKRDNRMQLGEEEVEAQADLTNVMRKHKVTSYKYEGKDGKMYEVYLPEEVKAKSRRVKEPKAPKAAE